MPNKSGGSIVDHNELRQGSDALFSELVDLRWDEGTILMRGRSGQYIANGHMTRSFAEAVHEQLGVLLATENVIAFPPKGKRKRKEKG